MAHRKKLQGLALFAALFAGVALGEREKERNPAGDYHAPAAVEDGISVYFSPDGGCEAAICNAIRNAHKSIDMQAYSFTNAQIAEAISQAKDRGIKIRAILDKDATGDQYSGATYLMHHKIATYTDAEHSIAHNKVMIIDGLTVITGSFNFTKQAERSNAENLLVIQGKPKLVDAYDRNFEHHLDHSKKYTQKEVDEKDIKDKQRESRRGG